jgi:hypothetical protein
MKSISYKKIFLFVLILLSNNALAIIGDEELPHHIPPIPPGEIIFPLPSAPPEDILTPVVPPVIHIPVPIIDHPSNTSNINGDRSSGGGSNINDNNSIKNKRKKIDNPRALRKSKSVPIRINYENNKRKRVNKSLSYYYNENITNKNIFSKRVVNNKTIINNKKNKLIIKNNNNINIKKRVYNHKNSIVIERKKRNRSFFRKIFKKFKKLF